MQQQALEILLIEDNPGDARLMELHLKDAALLFNMKTAASLQEAGEALSGTTGYDVVLLDLSLPDSAGLETFIRTSKLAETLPIIVMTGYDDDSTALACIERGAEDYLVKGRIDPQTLSRSLRYAIERKRYQIAARDSEERYSDVVSNVPGTVLQFTLNPEGEYSFPYVSEGSIHLTGLTPIEITADPDSIFSLLSESDYKHVWELIRESASSLAPLDLEIPLRLRNGEERRIRGRAEPRPHQDGSVTWTGVFLDVTAETQLKQQLEQSQRMESIGKLAGGVAHDFNNLLTIISGRAQLLAQDIEPGSPTRNDLEIILKTTERATALTRQLLTFSRKQRTSPKILDLSAALAEIYPILRPLMGENVEILIKSPPQDKLLICIDPTQLEQVILNLSVNARDAMLGGGRLIFSIEPSITGAPSGILSGTAVPMVTLLVEDTGSGIPPEIQAHIFEPFFTTKEKGQGTGLGLATVYGIVTQNGGIIDILKSSNNGTTFRVQFPCVVEDKAISTAGRTAEEPRHTAGNETVLVVEDEDELRILVAQILRAKGYHVLLARDGVDAMALAKTYNWEIDLLLTDVTMPHMGGPELARNLCKQNEKIRIMFFSGFTGNSVISPTDFPTPPLLLDKPFSADKLLQQVRAVLDEIPSQHI